MRGAFQRAMLLGLVTLFSLNALQAAYEIVRLQPLFHDYAIKWDERDRAIRLAKSQGARTVVVPWLRNWMGTEYDLARDAKYWINQCAGEYYGVLVRTDYPVNQ